MNFIQKVDKVLEDLKDILLAKNKAYGNSALEPVRIFSKVDALEQLKVRIDDKLSRLAKGTDFADEDTVTDLLGYLVLLKVATLPDETSIKLKEVMEGTEEEVQVKPLYKWVARDRNGMLFVYTHKPVKDNYTHSNPDRWYLPKNIPWGEGGYEAIDKELYPEVTFENSPMMLEKLKHKKEEVKDTLLPRNQVDEAEIHGYPVYKVDEYLEIGEVGYIQGKLVVPKLVAKSSCIGCTFSWGSCKAPEAECRPDVRRDNKHVVFEEVIRVEEDDEPRYDLL